MSLSRLICMKFSSTLSLLQRSLSLDKTTLIKNTWGPVALLRPITVRMNVHLCIYFKVLVIIHFLCVWVELSWLVQTQCAQRARSQCFALAHYLNWLFWQRILTKWICEYCVYGEKLNKSCQLQSVQDNKTWWFAQWGGPVRLLQVSGSSSKPGLISICSPESDSKSNTAKRDSHWSGGSQGEHTSVTTARPSSLL